MKTIFYYHYRKQDSINNKDFVLETDHITILSDKNSILKLKNLFNLNF